LTDSQEQGHDGDFVQSLDRGLSVIRAFDSDHPKLTLSEVAASTGLSRAAARRFLRTLVQLGYMRSDGSRFALRPKILELGYAYLSSLTLPEVAMPHLEQLVEQVHESSSVSELDGDDVIYIARVPTKRIMTVTISVGTRFPAYATSMGRVMLAAQSDERLDEYLDSASLRGLTDIPSPARPRCAVSYARYEPRAGPWSIRSSKRDCVPSRLRSRTLMARSSPPSTSPPTPDGEP
jgi:IclR family pca regulon transcriptional regulator